MTAPTAPLATQLRGLWGEMSTRKIVWSGEIEGMTAEIVENNMEMPQIPMSLLPDVMSGGPLANPYLCGYLEVPSSHPWSGKGYDDIDASVHGGLTYSEGNRIGFDCAHAGDSPEVQTLDYVKAELQSLVAQAIEATA